MSETPFYNTRSDSRFGPDQSVAQVRSLYPDFALPPDLADSEAKLAYCAGAHDRLMGRVSEQNPYSHGTNLYIGKPHRQH